MPTTNPDNIFFPDTSTAWATSSDFSVLASSTQNALNARERYTYRWPTASERGAETTMRQGDTGYQIDTRTEYLFDSGAWRLATPYAEFTTASRTVAGTGYTQQGAVTLNTGTSTSTTFASAWTGGLHIQLTDPGLYMISMYGVCSIQVDNAFAMVGIDTDAITNFASQIGRAEFAGDNVAMMTTFYRFSAANGVFYLYWKQNDATSRNYNSTVRILRIS